MAKNNMSNEVAKAWAEFTKDTEKAKEDILSVFNEDFENEEQNWSVFFIMGLMVVLVAFPIYNRVRWDFWLPQIILPQMYLVVKFNFRNIS